MKRIHLFITLSYTVLIKVKIGNLDILTILSEKKIDLNIKNNKGKTPVELADSESTIRFFTQYQLKNAYGLHSRDNKAILASKKGYGTLRRKNSLQRNIKNRLKLKPELTIENCKINDESKLMSNEVYL